MKKSHFILKVSLVACMFTGMYYKSISQEIGLTEKNYIIYDTKRNTQINLDSIVSDMKNYDVIFFGEEHDDSVTHYLQNLLLEKLYERYGNKIALSMEMFERGSQIILDEYLQGLIKESYFVKDAHAWSNYKDYRHMVEFAKEKHLSVIAANAAWRYVNMTNNSGVEHLMQLSDKAKTLIAPLPFKGATGGYALKLSEIMSYNRHSANDTTTEAKVPDIDTTKEMYFGQSIWDATMAYSIYEHLKAYSGKKVLHLNGRFHSDEYYGIVGQLKNYNPDLKILVISAGKDRTEKYPDIDFTEFISLGDYIIINDPSIPPSYK